MKSYTAEQLAQANGEDGKSSLVAVEGKVYDVSASKRWVHGEHMKRHRAGADLTNDIKAAPHGLEVLERFESVGIYEKEREEPAAGLKGRIELWLDRHPFFQETSSSCSGSHSRGAYDGRAALRVGGPGDKFLMHRMGSALLLNLRLAFNSCGHDDRLFHMVD